MLGLKSVPLHLVQAPALPQTNPKHHLLLMGGIDSLQVKAQQLVQALTPCLFPASTAQLLSRTILVPFPPGPPTIPGQYSGSPTELIQGRKRFYLASLSRLSLAYAKYENLLCLALPPSLNRPSPTHSELSMSPFHIVNFILMSKVWLSPNSNGLSPDLSGYNSLQVFKAGVHWKTDILA